VKESSNEGICEELSFAAIVRICISCDVIRSGQVR
jgi:hypothetical protein